MQNIFGKIKLYIISFLVLTFLLVPFFVFTADQTENQKNQYGATDVYEKTPLPKIGIANMDNPIVLAQAIVRSILGFVGIIFFLLFVYAGYTWIKARDTSAEIDKAKSIIESALIGIIIITLAYAISEFIFSRLVLGQLAQ